MYVRMFYNKIYTFKDSMKVINDVTIESVNKCIRDYFVIDKMSVAIAGKVQ